LPGRKCGAETGVQPSLLARFRLDQRIDESVVCLQTSAMAVLQSSQGTVTLEEMAKLVTDGSELCRRCRWGPSSKGGATTYLFHGALCFVRLL
jgi:hypothetical protein